MRKLLNYALAAILAVGLVPAAAFAEPTSDQGVSAYAGEPLGEVNVTLKREDALAETTFTLKMTPVAASEGAAVEGEAIQGTAIAKALEEKSFLVLPHVKNGTYKLEISAPRYLTYTIDNVTVNDNCVNVDLYEIISKNEGRGGEGLPLVGVIPVGDLNNDGVINDVDADIMSKAVERGDTNYDLTGDGKIDIADLSVVVRNEGATTVVDPYMGEPSKALVAAVDNVQVTGTAKGADGAELNETALVEALIDKTKADSTVSIASANGKEISADNPVSIALAADKNDENAALSKEAQAIVIAAPTPKVTVNPETGESTKTNASTMTGGTVKVEAVAGEDISQDGNVVAREGDAIEIEATVGSETSALSAYSIDAFASATKVQARGVTIENDGSVIIDLGTRVAIKKVTIDVTKVADKKNPTLAEIATVEFLQDFENRIPEPQLSIPEIDKNSVVFSKTNATEGTKDVTFAWTKQTNVTGYEVSIAGPGYTKTALTEGEKATDSHYVSYTFKGSKSSGTAKAGNTYTLKVRSVSGNWRSNWSEPVEAKCEYNNVPSTPEYVTATVGVQSLNVTWRCKFDGVSYTIQYAKGSAASINWSSPSVTTVNDITSTSYRIAGLEGGVKYAFRVQAHNPFGDSGWSSAGEASPRSSSLASMPKYDLINTDNASDGNLASTHIKSITGIQNKSYTIYKKDGSTVTNANATAADWNALIDNDAESYLYINDWDSGVSYANFRGPCITLDQPTTMDTVRIMPSDKHTSALSAVRIRYLDADNSYKTVNTQLSTKYDNEGRMYYEIVANEKFTTSYFELRTSNVYAYTNHITIADMKLYNYNSLDDDIAAIFTDDQRLEVKEGVTEAQINELIARSNERQPGTASAANPEGEMHPHHDMQIADLNYALEYLKTGAAAEPMTVDNQITATGSPANGIAMSLSDYQSLGRVAAAGDVVVIYVTDTDGTTAKGNNVNLRLVATQVHPEVANWQSSAIQLKAGRNEITIPRIGSYAQESGGSLYLQYTGAKGAKNYTVRVTGAEKIPMLNVDGITGAERTAAIEKYVQELKTHVANLTSSHEAKHAGSSNAFVNDYAYDKHNCILNYTDIQIDNMMYSLPADASYACLAADPNPAQKLETTIAGMEQEIDYFYQFKGMNRAATDKDAYPFMRLNVRYHRMFTGAFMYAGGKHIGIEYGSTGSAFRLAPVTTVNGKQQATFSGWGLSHEIGHVINAAAYAHAEVTNNVFAQLAKSMSEGETNAKFRTPYNNVYAMVTGQTSLPAKHLAMYWQLHLAYDNASVFTLYPETAEGIAQQQQNVFYARLESYLRDPSKAPHALTNTAGDQGLMQAACAAANKDCLDFFRAWGLVPSAETEAYAKQYEKETRKLQYIDDDSRNYRMQGGSGSATNATVTAEVVNATNQRVQNTNQVKIALSSNASQESLLGYEIKRNGKVVAFVTPDQLKDEGGKKVYADTIKTENNKTFVYTVTVIDRLLGESAVCTLPEVKVQHDGSIDKTGWAATTSMSSPRDQVVEKNDEDPESGIVNGNTKPGVEKQSAIGCVLDGDKDTVYYGIGSSQNRPSVTIDMGTTEQVTALKFTPAPEGYTGDAATNPDTNEVLVPAADLYKYRLFGYKIETSLDGTSWTVVKQGNSFVGNASNPSTWQAQPDVKVNDDGSYTLYFNKVNEDGTNDPFMYTYDARFVRMTATNMSNLAIAELDVLGPTSDNVELVPEGFGRLSADYKYTKQVDENGAVTEQGTIPAGSIVFYGEYRGDPSYNIVLLRDQDGNVLNGEQLFFADVPKEGMLGETSDGRWIFWFETQAQKDQLSKMTSVQVSLYRVQDALTLEGQRVTSTSLTMTKLSPVPDVEITDSSKPSKMQPAEGESLLMSNSNNIAALSAHVEGDTVVTSQGDTYTIAQEEAPEVEEPSTSEPLFGLFSFGDTGATDGEVADAPVQLMTTESGFDALVDVSESSIAVRASFQIDPANACNVALTLNNNNNVYKYYSYDSGVLNVMTVARSGIMGSNTSLLVSVSGLKGETTLTTKSYKELAEHSHAVESQFDPLSVTFTPDAGENPDNPNPPVDPDDPNQPVDPDNPNPPVVDPIEPDRDIQNATTRVGRGTSVQTSVDISKTAYPDGCEWVVIARSDDFQDAMSATALAGAIDCPILLTERTTTSQEIVAETYRLGAKNAYVIGGTVALPAEVESDLKQINVESTRIAGENAWDTSVKCAKAVASFGNKAGRDVIIATSVNFQDALSISGFAFKYGVPIFLTDAEGKLPSEANDTIMELGGTVYVAGGTVVVPRTTAEVAYGTRVQRIWGEDGYDTSNQIANYMLDNGYLDNKAVCIASGDLGAKGLDALAGAALAGKNDAPVLLVSGSKLPGAEPWNNTVINGRDSKGDRGFVAANAISLGKMYILGGDSIIHDDIRDDIHALVKATYGDKSNSTDKPDTEGDQTEE